MEKERFRPSPEEREKEKKLGQTFKRITVLGTFGEPKDETERETVVSLGKTLAREDVSVLVGGESGYPGAIKEGVVSENGRILIAEPSERKKQGKKVENVTGHARGIELKDWEHIKQFLFHESSDAYIFLPPSGTLGTITESIEAVDRMTYWGTIDNPKLSPMVFVGKKWEEPFIQIPGTNQPISPRQLLEGLIQTEKQIFDERGIKLNKSDYIAFVENPEKAIDFLRSWADIQNE